jgi:hypothetical protein
METLGQLKKTFAVAFGSRRIEQGVGALAVER